MANKFFKKPYLILLAIIIIGLFLRTFDFTHRFIYGHDADLYSWIVKDMVVNHHVRLIGQLTSTPGIFIGGFYYYLLIPFFLMTSMDPIGAYYLGIVLSVFTIWSCYYVFKNSFSVAAGLIAAALYAVLLSRISFDIWPVPTVLIPLWTIWFFYCLVLLLKGKEKGYYLLAILISLIWHISFTMAPYLLTIPFVIFFSKVKPRIKTVIQAGILTLITSVPLLVFESRHGFSQTKALFDSFVTNQKGATGFDKLWHVLYQIGNNATSLLFYPHSSLNDFFTVSPSVQAVLNSVFTILPKAALFEDKERLFFRLLVLIIFLGIGIFLSRKKVLETCLAALLGIWFVSSVFYFTFSSKIISEYYFEGLSMIFFCLTVLILSYLASRSQIGRLVVGVSLIGLAAFSVYNVVTDNHAGFSGYSDKKAVVAFIAEDAHQKGYPCVAISYVVRPGDILGLRYFSYLYNLKVVSVNKDLPIYSVVYPLSLIHESPTKRFGPIGVITPQNEFKSDDLNQKCSGPDISVTDPMFGYTE